MIVGSSRTLMSGETHRSKRGKKQVMSTLVTRKKTIHGGVPVVTGTRVPVSVLVPYAFEKNGITRAKAEYPDLTIRQIVAAWEYAEKKIFDSVHDAPSQI